MKRCLHLGTRGWLFFTLRVNDVNRMLISDYRAKQNLLLSVSISVYIGLEGSKLALKSLTDGFTADALDHAP
jgi:hypothetical protein